MSFSSLNELKEFLKTCKKTEAFNLWWINGVLTNDAYDYCSENDSVFCLGKDSLDAHSECIKNHVMIDNGYIGQGSTWYKVDNKELSEWLEQ